MIRKLMVAPTKQLKKKEEEHWLRKSISKTNVTEVVNAKSYYKKKHREHDLYGKVKLNLTSWKHPHPYKL